MKKILLLLLTILVSVAYSQDETNSQPIDKLVLSFNQNDFGERLSVLYDSDDRFDYYVIDMTKIGGRFERVYFMNLTYQDNRIINVDPEIEKEHIWFKAYYKYTEEEITCLFRDLKEASQKAAAEMAEAEKADWLSRHDKFRKAE